MYIVYIVNLWSVVHPWKNSMEITLNLFSFDMRR